MCTEISSGPEARVWEVRVHPARARLRGQWFVGCRFGVESAPDKPASKTNVSDAGESIIGMFTVHGVGINPEHLR